MVVSVNAAMARSERMDGGEEGGVGFHLSEVIFIIDYFVLGFLLKRSCNSVLNNSRSSVSKL